MGGSVHTLVALRARGVDGRVANTNGHFPVHKAAQRRQGRACRWLAAVYPEALACKDAEGNTPYDLAKAEGADALAAALRPPSAAGAVALSDTAAVAEALRARSWALVRLPAAAAAAVAALSASAGEYLDRSREEAPDGRDTVLVDENGGRALLGYNRVSAAKRLWRARCGHDAQPWPSAALRADAQAASAALDAAARGVVAALGGAAVAAPAAHPLDVFLYHNADSNVANCTEHVDRGLVSIIAVSEVPGLEVPLDGCWHAPEDGAAAHLDAVVIVNAALSSTSSSVKACVHRVRDGGAEPRVSVSYELR